MTPPTVNAYYDPTNNEIVFPAGILQPPFFNATADDAVNYGAIGAVIGHEMTHGFDDQGRQFDAQGNLADWWTPQPTPRRSTSARSASSTSTAASKSLPGVHMNGKLVQGEAIADLGGTTIAFKAFQRTAQYKAHKKHRRLHARAALLPRLRAGLALAADRGLHAPAREPRPAPERPPARDRDALEHARVPPGVRLRGDDRDGAQEPVPNLVMHPARLAVRALGAAALTALVVTSLPNVTAGARAAAPAAGERAGDRPGEPRPDVQGLRRLLPVRDRRLVEAHAAPGRARALGRLRRARAAQPRRAARHPRRRREDHERSAGSDTQKLGTFYRACMNDRAIEHAGTAPVAPLLGAIAAAHDVPSLVGDGRRAAAQRRRRRPAALRSRRHEELRAADRRARRSAVSACPTATTTSTKASAPTTIRSRVPRLRRRAARRTSATSRPRRRPKRPP